MRWLAALVLALGAGASLWLSLPPAVQEPPQVERATSYLPEGLSRESLVRLRNWLQEESVGRQEAPERDLFREAVEPVPTLQPAANEPAVTAVVPPIPPPRLAGFVLRDEDNEASRVLAAIRFEGRVWLVGEGELVGTYRVQRIVLEDEEVFLVEEGGGQESRIGID
jgi:hypothetical protein